MKRLTKDDAMIVVRLGIAQGSTSCDGCRYWQHKAKYSRVSCPFAWSIKRKIYPDEEQFQLWLDSGIRFPECKESEV